MINDNQTKTTPSRNNDAPAAPVAPHGTAAHDDHDDIPQDLPRVSGVAVAIVAFIAVAAFVGLFLLGWVPRERRIAELKSDLTSDTRPVVETALPTRDIKPLDLWLPADARAMQETSIFPRANGYLKRLLVDIGDRVKEGQLLAEIDAPEVDADLNQARASLGQAQANAAKAQQDYELAEATSKGYDQAGASGGITQQQLDEKRSAQSQAQAALVAAKANISAAQASVQRLEAMQSFQKVTAPFAGTVTARNYDVGALLSPTN